MAREACETGTLVSGPLLDSDGLWLFGPGPGHVALCLQGCDRPALHLGCGALLLKSVVFFFFLVKKSPFPA